MRETALAFFSRICAEEIKKLESEGILKRKGVRGVSEQAKDSIKEGAEVKSL